MSNRPLTPKEAKAMFAATDEAKTRREELYRARIDLWRHRPDVGYKLNPERCVMGISVAPYYLHSHQCSRKAKVTVAGFDLCNQHAKKVTS